MATEEEITRSANILGLILRDPERLAQVQNDPSCIDRLIQEAVGEADKLNRTALNESLATKDTQIYKTAIYFLGLTVLATILGGVANTLVTSVKMAGLSVEEAAKYQAFLGMPESLVTIASMAVGALAGLLAPLGGRK